MSERLPTCALVAASDFNAEHFLAWDAEGRFDYVIAVDAGFAHVEGVGRVPDMAIGDFDSLGYVPSCPRVSRHPIKKDKSDLELAFERAMSRNYSEFVVYGALGGRLDHTVANVQLMACYAEAGVDITAIGVDCMARLLVGPDAYTLPIRERGTVSVFALTPQATGVCERGLEYPLDEATLSNRTTLGLSNELIGQPAAIAVESGTLLVFHPLE